MKSFLIEVYFVVFAGISLFYDLGRFVLIFIEQGCIEVSLYFYAQFVSLEAHDIYDFCYGILQIKIVMNFTELARAKLGVI